MQAANWTQVFINPKHPKFFAVNDFFALLTIVSVAVVVLETVPSLGAYQSWFTVIEWISVVLFTFEYIARTIATKPSLKYTFSFFGIVDLLAVLPSFFGAGNLTFLKAARALRIIRLLRLIRTTAMHNHSKEEDFNPVLLNVMIYFAALMMALLTFGTLMYLIENSSSAFLSIPAGMWWSLKVFLGSVPVDLPATSFGAALHVLTRFTGMLLLGLLLGVVGNIFRAMLGDEEK